MIRRALLHVRSVLLRRRLEREMQEEMAEHLERATARFMSRGLSADDARRAAEREFGNLAWLQEQARDARGTAWLDALAGDLRYAVRQYARRPATTVVMFLVLAIGMSIATLLFSFVHSFATQPPPGVTLTDDMMRIRGSQSAGSFGRGARSFGEDEFAAYGQLSGHFAEVAGWTAASAALDAGPEPERRGLEARVTFVTDNYFSLLGVRPLLGAGLATTASDDSFRTATAVISHATWDRLFDRDPDIVGTTVTLNGVSATIAGVTPERFLGVAGWGDYRLWMPLSARELLFADGPALFSAAGRLQPGVTPQQATAAAQVVAAVHAAAAADADRAAARGANMPLDPSTEVVPLRSASGDPMYERDVKLMSGLVGLLALLVLLITCTNVSALLTGLAAARRHEIAVRLSLGAARPRLIRQLLTESALLAFLAAAAALGIVWAALRTVFAAITELPLEPRLTLPATAFTFGVALGVGVLFGLSPALHATRLAVAGVLRDASANVVATRARLQRTLVVAQIAFTQPLIVLLSALLLLVLTEFQAAPRSEYADRTMVLSLRTWSNSAASPEAAAQLREQMRNTTFLLAERLRATPGVVGVAPTGYGQTRIGGYIATPDRPADAALDVVRLSKSHVHPDYFDVMGIPVLRGRTFAQDEGVPPRGTAPVPAIIDRGLARRMWPGGDAIGRELRPASDTVTRSPTLVVVGVVDAPAARRQVAGIDHFIFLPLDTAQHALAGSAGGSMAPGELLLRTALPAHTLLPTVRALAQAEAPGASVTLRTLADIADEHERNFRLAATGVSAAGLMALLLAAIGLYAVIAFSVGQRTREIAVRMALGGHRPQVVRRFVADGLRLTAVGLLVGLPVSLFALRTLMSAAGTPHVPLPPVTVLAGLSVVLVAAVAAWIPARRAAAVDPAVTLRSE
jgi:putative ABC transport system permease protein